MISYAAHQNNRGGLNLEAAFLASANLSGSLDTALLLNANLVVQPALQAALTTEILLTASLAARHTLNGYFAGTEGAVANPERTYRVLHESRIYEVTYESRIFHFEPEDGAHIDSRSLQ